MSLDYPDRKVWLAIRENRNLERQPRYLRVMPATGKTKDPGRIHAHRRRRGPLMTATGPGSYHEWKQALAEERAATRAML